MRKYISTKCHCKFSSCTRKYRILLRYVLELCAFKLFRFFFVFSFSFILFNLFCVWNYSLRLNRLTANPTKWSNTLKQFAGNLPTNCLSVFNHFVKLTLKGPKRGSLLPKFYCDCNLNSTESYEPPPEIYGDLVNFELLYFQDGDLPFLNLLRELIFLGITWLLR